jgi:hypothetical protein
MHIGMLSPLVPLLLLAAPATPPADGPTRAQAVALAAPKLSASAANEAALEPEDEGTLVLKPWRQRPGTWIALVPEISENRQAESPATLHLALIAREGQRWAAVARTDDARASDTGPGDLSYTLDLAPYRLNETEVAFGVREHADQKSPTDPMLTENLLLYRMVGARLVRIFFETVHMEWNDRDEDGIGNGTATSHSVVAVSKNKTAGFFDLVVTDNTDLPKPKTTVTTYAWKGEAYQEVTRPKPAAPPRSAPRRRRR